MGKKQFDSQVRTKITFKKKNVPVNSTVTGAVKKLPTAVFLDRDGVINKKIEMDYVKKWEEFKFLPGAISAIKFLNDNKIPVYLITNQSGIGRGMMTSEDLNSVHNKMKSALKIQGAHFDDVFVCPHAPEKNCDCRKPKAGLLLQAKKKYPDIDFKSSWFIGDSQSDVEVGMTVGCRTYLIKKGESLRKIVLRILNGKN